MEGPLIAWTAHPARRRPRDLALAVCVLAITCAVVLESFGSLFLAALALVFLVVSIAPFLLPTRFTVTGEDIAWARVLGQRRRRFADLRRLEVGKDTLLLSPFARPHWLDRHRGVFVLLDGLDGTTRERLLELLRAKVAA